MKKKVLIGIVGGIVTIFLSGCEINLNSSKQDEAVKGDKIEKEIDNVSKKEKKTTSELKDKLDLTQEEEKEIEKILNELLNEVK